MISRTVGWLTLFVVGTDLFVVSPLLPRIAAELNVGVGSAGWMVSAFALAYLAGGPRFGALADRIGRGRVLAVALTGFAAANLLTGLAPDFVVLLVARACAGLAASGITPSVYALISASAPERQRATWLAVVTSGLLLALVTGAPAGSLLAPVIGWHGVFLLLAGAAVVLLALCAPVVRRVRPDVPDTSGASAGPGAAVAGATPARTAVPGPLPLRARVRAVLPTSLWALAVYGLYTYLGAGLHGTTHLPGGLVAAALAIYGAGAVTGNLCGGPLADRYGGARVTIASLAGLAMVEAALGLAVHAGAVFLAGLGLFALAAYPYFAAHQLRLVGAFPAHAGTVLAWNNTAMYGGILVGSAVGGQILAGAGFTALLAAAAGAGLLGALTARRAVPARPGREPVPEDAPARTA